MQAKIYKVAFTGVVYFGQSRKIKVSKLYFHSDAYIKTHGADCLAGITNNQF